MVFPKEHVWEVSEEEAPCCAWAAVGNNACLANSGLVLRVVLLARTEQWAGMAEAEMVTVVVAEVVLAVCLCKHALQG